MTVERGACNLAIVSIVLLAGKESFDLMGWVGLLILLAGLGVIIYAPRSKN